MSETKESLREYRKQRVDEFLCFIYECRYSTINISSIFLTSLSFIHSRCCDTCYCFVCFFFLFVLCASSSTEWYHTQIKKKAMKPKAKKIKYMEIWNEKYIVKPNQKIMWNVAGKSAFSISLFSKSLMENTMRIFEVKKYMCTFACGIPYTSTSYLWYSMYYFKIHIFKSKSNNTHTYIFNFNIENLGTVSLSFCSYSPSRSFSCSVLLYHILRNKWRRKMLVFSRKTLPNIG